VSDRRPLDGIRVLDLSRLLPGPFLTLVLADLGADVVKVEEPDRGDYLRDLVPALDAGLGARFAAINRDKRSLALDLKSESGRAAFLRLVEQADVVVESFRPGVLERLGLGWGALSARNPKLILCSLSGYGQDGPYRDRPGHDINYLALAGVLAMSGVAGGAPMLPGVPIADLAGGALWGAVAVLSALIARATSGRGQRLDMSLTEGALALLASDLGILEASRRELGRDCATRAPTRGATALTGARAAYGVYAARDGRYLALGALEPKFWSAFNRAIGRNASEAEEADRDPASIRAEIQAILLQRSRDAWAEAFARAGVPCEPVLEPEELPGHPLHAARGAFFTAPERDGRLPFPQARLPVGEPKRERGAPHLGEHSAEVLSEYGFSPPEIESLLTR
jgi:crotonobetainyl-CoA:carnitine CoA-transferase CaiB-like acyl-CoA transferase